MAMIEARTGNPLSTRSAEAAALYNEAIDLVLGSQSGSAQKFDRALELDADFAMAAAARYYVEMDRGGPDSDRFRAQATASADQASAWEREHIDILIGLMADAANTVDQARDYIRRTPADLLVVSQLGGHFFFYGGPDKLTAVLDLLESVGPALQDDWAYQARLGFAASEAGDLNRGRELIERALGARPDSLYTIHALAHLLHDAGAAEESAQTLQAWLAKHGNGARSGQMYGHVQWHLALAEWQTGKREAAWERYEAYCSPGTTTCGPVLTLADCGGFLLRDYLASGETRALTKDTLEHIERFWPMISHPFIALHVAGLFASAGDVEGLEKCRETILGAPASSNRETSLALVSALTDIVAGNHDRSARTLASVNPAARVGIGGSNVERILVDLLEKCALQLSTPQ
jgi:tetratricopeptide (TPR) repeat protein